MAASRGEQALRRRRGNWWAWLVGLVVLVFGIWGVRVLLQNEAEIDDPSTISTPAGDAPEPSVVPAPADR